MAARLGAAIVGFISNALIVGNTYEGNRMTDKEKVDFYERWIKCLDNLCPEARAKTNSASISMTGQYVGVNVHGIVDICVTENDRWKTSAKFTT